MIDYNKLGLHIYLDFITEDEEKEILKFVSKGNVINKTAGRNRIQRFGSDAPYKTNMISKTIPDVLDKISDKIMEQGLLVIKPDSITVNEYLKSQSITPHIDSVASGRVISVLSLMSPAVMKFHLRDSFKVDLPPRSLVQMRDEIRDKWRHSIEPVPANRYSIVFRCSKDK